MKRQRRCSQGLGKGKTEGLTWAEEGGDSKDNALRVSGTEPVYLAPVGRLGERGQVGGGGRGSHREGEKRSAVKVRGKGKEEQTSFGVEGVDPLSPPLFTCNSGRGWRTDELAKAFPGPRRVPTLEQRRRRLASARLGCVSIESC